MATPAQPGQPQPDPGPDDARSDNLLPADEPGDEDGRFDVAEEVNLDQQSDSVRGVGHAPDTTPREDIERDVPGAP